MFDLISKINIFNENEYKEAIESALSKEEKNIFFYLNSQIIYEAHNNLDVGNYILSANHIIADGYAAVWAYKKILNNKIAKVVFTYSYFKFIREIFIRNASTTFFLGASEKTLSKAIEIEKNNFPLLKIVGYNNGYFDKQIESQKIISKINESKAQVLIVGMGCPISEKWIVENKENLSPKLIFSVGGFFDFLAKDKIVAPKWMYNSGFEWVFRLIQEPKRLFKRYLFANSFILFKVLFRKF